MVNTSVIPFVTPAVAVGRPDYSMSIQRSVSNAALTGQVPQSGAFVFPSLPTVPYPFTYFFPFTASPNSFRIPIGYSLFAYSGSVTGDTNATSVIGVQIYDDYDPVTNTLGNLFQTICLKYAPKTAEVHLPKGLSLIDYAGKFLIVLFAHYSANPFFTVDLTIHGIIDARLVAEGEALLG